MQHAVEGLREGVAALAAAERALDPAQRVGGSRMHVAAVPGNLARAVLELDVIDAGDLAPAAASTIDRVEMHSVLAAVPAAGAAVGAAVGRRDVERAVGQVQDHGDLVLRQFVTKAVRQPWPG
ncbi:hypothetical protein [Streptomyces sp. NPDC058247]|uniref:hypothetical protein n=1 Tax=Streptomyces sp. NPDC058247 TaxID=3346401 RepID=UPI0036E77C10